MPGWLKLTVKIIHVVFTILHEVLESKPDVPGVPNGEQPGTVAKPARSR